MTEEVKSLSSVSKGLSSALFARADKSRALTGWLIIVVLSIAPPRDKAADSRRSSYWRGGADDRIKLATNRFFIDPILIWKQMDSLDEI